MIMKCLWWQQYFHCRLPFTNIREGDYVLTSNAFTQLEVRDSVALGNIIVKKIDT